jgi:DNA-directed RNA polymerase specialized sigma24 family protein
VALLSNRFELFDIADTAGFVGAIVNRSGLALSWSDREDLEQYLLVTAWEISLTFEPGKGSVGFSTYAGNILRRRTHDWVRQRNGRTVWKFSGGRVHTRERPQLVPFDNAVRDRMDQSFAEGDGDREADWDSPLGRLLRERDREATRDLYEMGLEPPRRAA